MPSVSLMKTPLNLNNIVFHNQTEKNLFEQQKQNKNKKSLRKNQIKNFILSSNNDSNRSKTNINGTNDYVPKNSFINIISSDSK